MFCAFQKIPQACGGKWSSCPSRQSRRVLGFGEQDDKRIDQVPPVPKSLRKILQAIPQGCSVVELASAPGQSCDIFSSLPVLQQKCQSHLVAIAFDLGGDTGRKLKPQDLPFDFSWSGSRFVLRSMVLGSNSHFTCVVRCPNAWLHCDGLKSRRIELHPLGTRQLQFHSWSLPQFCSL